MALIDLITTGINGILKPVNDIVHEWVKSSADKTLDQTKEKEFQLQIQLVINEQANKIAEQAQTEMNARLKDVENARAMQVAALQQEDKFSKRFIYIFAAGIILIAAAFDFCLYFVSIPPSNAGLVNDAFKILNYSGAGAVLVYFFGIFKNNK